MSTSILNDVKHLLGLLPEETAFDGDLIILINSQFAKLTQLGVGPIAGYEITSDGNMWDEFFDDVRLNAVKSYVFLNVRLSFDPPKTGFELSAIERQIDELVYRINIVVDYG